MEKVLFIGGRRGLGARVRTQWHARFPEHVLTISSRQSFTFEAGHTLLADLSKPEGLATIIEAVGQTQPQRVFYFAGGGPYGAFASKSWKDHEWALQVSLISAMRVVHEAITTPSVEQVVVVGSAIAEDQPDENAASYCAAKHGLKGFISTIHKEYPNKDIRLFSPGYMATDMVPPPAREGKSVADPDQVAAQFISWVLEKEAPWHLRNPTD